jgi:tetratricopeptide (TPR) repeat protein
MKFAYLGEGDCLSKVTANYEQLKSSVGGLINPKQLESEYLFSRYRCGVLSAIDELKSQSGPTLESFFANSVLGEYYKSIGENQLALRYFQYQFNHAPDSNRKLNSAISLGEFLSEIGKPNDGLSFLKEQISYFHNNSDQAALWEAIGNIFGASGSHWHKALCFEKSLTLNPDNTTLRFALAYSYGNKNYGKAMARHHYGVLLQQTPLDSTAANNLSVIYDEMGAVTKKVALLQRAQRRKDSAYVGANLATAYAKAGFIEDARDCLQQISVIEQQENIVQTAYRVIKNQTDNDQEIVKKLDRLAQVQRNMFGVNIQEELIRTDEELVQSFVGEWQSGDATIVIITVEAGNLTAKISTENKDYEYASYHVTTEYEPGLLQLYAQLEEASLKERPKSEISRTPNALRGVFGAAITGLTIPSLLGGNALTRPVESFEIIVVPGEPDVLCGLECVFSGPRPTGIFGGSMKRKDEAQSMLDAKEVRLTRRTMSLSRLEVGDGSIYTNGEEDAPELRR